MYMDILELDSVSLYFIYGFAVYNYREYVTFLKYQIGPYINVWPNLDYG